MGQGVDVIPAFGGKVIQIVKIDYGLLMWTADNWEILLAGPVLVGVADAPPVEVVVDLPDSPLPPQLSGLVGSTITQLLVSDDGDLALQLGDRQLVAPAACDYEAWQIGGHDGELLICTPGGELVHFPPVRRAPEPVDGSPSGV